MIEINLNIKPLSVNKAWKGRRFKTNDYKDFERSMILMLPKLKKVPKNTFGVSLKYGFSSKLSDIDNPTKLVLDILCKKYGFDDRDIYELTLRKEIVKKGKEFIKIVITEIQ